MGQAEQYQEETWGQNSMGELKGLEYYHRSHGLQGWEWRDDHDQWERTETEGQWIEWENGGVGVDHWLHEVGDASGGEGESGGEASESEEGVDEQEDLGEDET